MADKVKKGYDWVSDKVSWVADKVKSGYDWVNDKVNKVKNWFF